MKLLILWIVVALAAGILLAGWPLLPPMRPVVWLAWAVVFLLASLGLVRRSWPTPAWIAALLAWVFLGALAARLEQLAHPPNHITALLAQGRLDSSEALRWRGRLRENPLRLPWGLRYEMDLDEVIVAGEPVAIAGGLRVNSFLPGSAAGDSASPPGLALRAGDRVEALVRARQPRNFGNPGAPDLRASFAREGIHVIGSLRSPELLTLIGKPPPTLGHRLARLRGRLLEELDAMFASDPGRAAVLRAMLLGDRSFMDHERAEAFQKSAAYHVLVIAGLHVGALVAFVFWAGRWLRLSPAARTLLTLLVLGAYVAIVQDRPPILRAALMAATFLIARLLFRRVDLLNIAALAALVILVAQPSALTAASFQLSFLAVGVIGALAAPWIERTSEPYVRALEHLTDVTRDAAHAPRPMQFRLDARALAQWLEQRLPVRLTTRAASLVCFPCIGALRIWEVFVLSATIQLGMLPLLACYFHRVSLAGPFANIPAVLLTGLIVPFGFLSLLASLIWSALGSFLAKVLGLLVAALDAAVRWFAHWPWLSYRIPRPPAWELAAFFAVLVLLAAAVRHSQHRWQWIAAAPLALLAIGVVTYPYAPNLEPGRLEITVLDVAQGDSILAAFPGGHTMLVDGGGLAGAARMGGVRTATDIGEQVVSSYVWFRGLKKLDVVVLTHAHQDHLGGLASILENFRVRELWVGRDVAGPAYNALLELARRRGVRVVHHIRGDDFTWDGVHGHFLWPDSSAQVESARNNDSLVLRLEHHRVALLLPGDIESQIESGLTAGDDALGADFLKVSHHGSKTSTGAAWLDRVHPRAAAISVGEANPFGHPNSGVLQRLRGAGVRVLRTDYDGAVTAISDGQSLRIRSFYASP